MASAPQRNFVYSFSAWTLKQKSGSLQIPSMLLNKLSMQLLEFLNEIFLC